MPSTRAEFDVTPGNPRADQIASRLRDLRRLKELDLASVETVLDNLRGESPKVRRLRHDIDQLRAELTGLPAEVEDSWPDD
jgi:hypothetical protein